MLEVTGLLNNGEYFDVIYIGQSDPLYFINGKKYKARYVKPDRKGNKMLGVFDETKEEYVYAADLFIIKNEPINNL